MGSPAEARSRLERLDARLIAPRRLERNALLDHADGSLQRSDSVLRLRRSGERAELAYKGPGRVEAGVKARVEIETTVADADAMLGILEEIGFRPSFRYEKYREVYSALDVEIVVDETPIGTFLEVEGAPEAIRAAATGLGFAAKDFVLESYPELYRASGGAGDMLFGQDR